MRTLLTLTLVGILVLVAGSAGAENRHPEPGQMTVYQPRIPALASHGHATLTLSRMHLEIHKINLEAVEKERALLSDLAAAQDETLVDRLIIRLERLETGRQIDVLQIRVRHARCGGRYDEAFALKREILKLTKSENTMPM